MKDILLSQTNLNDAVRVVQQGGVIAYPTESSFGLGCDPKNLSALKRILSIKQRPADKGLIMLVSNISQARDFLLPLNSHQIEKISRASDRATTWLIPRDPNLPVELCGIHPKLAVRVTQHPVARAICEGLGFPLVSTSCNLSGKPAMSDACAIKVQMGEILDLIVPGNVGGQDASQIIDLESGQVLRS